MSHRNGSGNRNSDPFVTIELISEARLTTFIIVSSAAELPAGQTIIAEDPKTRLIGHALYNTRFAVVRQLVERSIADRLHNSQILSKCPRTKSWQLSQAATLANCENMAVMEDLLYGITARIEYSSNRGKVTVARPLAQVMSSDLPSGCIVIDFGA